MARFFKGLGALAVLAAVIVGIPAFLVLVVGDPLPTAAQWNGILQLQPDYGNTVFFTKLLPVIAWICWALFAFPWVYEVAAAAAGRPSGRRAPVFRFQQKTAAALIAAVFLMFAVAPALSSSAPAHAETAPATVAAVPAARPADPLPVQAAPPPAPRTDLHYTVAEGDNLWNLAADYLGNGDLYPEIVAASSAIQQPDGQYLTDPDFIEPGWQLVIPGAGPAAPAQPPAPAPAPAGTQGRGQSAGGNGAGGAAPAAANPRSADSGGASARRHTRAEGAQETPATTPARAAAVTPAAAHDAEDGANLVLPLATAGGVVALLAAGLVIALDRRRKRQRRRRQTGQRIAMPPAQDAAAELELRMVENSLALEDIDNAMRSLQIWAEDTGNPLPELLAVRLDGQEIALYLLNPADLPTPFESASPDRTAWILRPDTVRPPSRDAISPYPALISIGRDRQGGILLLDLEQIGALALAGDCPDAIRGMLNAMAVELTTSPWAEGIELTLVGLPIRLAQSVDRYRVQHVEDVNALLRNLRADLDDRRGALATYGASDVRQGRVNAATLDTWAPHIVILAEEPDEGLLQELDDLVSRTPRLGIATISSGAPTEHASTIRLASPEDAVYSAADGAIDGLPFTPQILAGIELERIQHLFDTTETASHPADLVIERHPIPAAPIQEDFEWPDDEPDDTQTASAPEHGPDAGAAPEQSWKQAVVPALSDDLVASFKRLKPPHVQDTPRDPSPAPDTPDMTAGIPDAAAPATAPIECDSITDITEDGSGQDILVPDWHPPFIRLLGPVDALNLDTSGSARTIEFLAYLSLATGPVSGAQMEMALFGKNDPNAPSTRKTGHRIRVAIGADPAGNLLLPLARNSRGFTAHPAITTDWQVFCDLIGGDLAAASNENLISALRLVRGQPFTGAGARKGWWAWRINPDGVGGLEEDMIAAIIDAAEELTDRAVRQGDVKLARLAAGVAKAADSSLDAGWRMEIRAALIAHDPEAFNQVVDDLYAAQGRVDSEYEPDQETQELITAGKSQLGGE